LLRLFVHPRYSCRSYVATLPVTHFAFYAWFRFVGFPLLLRDQLVALCICIGWLLFYFVIFTVTFTLRLHVAPVALVLRLHVVHFICALVCTLRAVCTLRSRIHRATTHVPTIYVVGLHVYRCGWFTFGYTVLHLLDLLWTDCWLFIYYTILHFFFYLITVFILRTPLHSIIVWIGLHYIYCITLRQKAGGGGLPWRTDALDIPRNATPYGCDGVRRELAW